VPFEADIGGDAMAILRDELYVHPAWLAKLMAGEASCAWAAWYRVHYSNWSRPASDFDEAKYRMEHTRLVREMREQRDATNERLFVDRQASFWYTHSNGIRLSANPDLVALGPEGNCTYEAKIGTPRASHRIQSLIYMHLLPKSDHPAFFGRTFSGQIQYADHVIDLSPEETQGPFEEQFGYWMDLMASTQPLERVPSQQECSFCNIDKPDCPDRLAGAIAGAE
jgi:hypothetical protein